ncbi:MAG: type I-F CRISPR-associated endoribonuclease Cas6/Csy4 [Proteobacteria bacterium]|nr:type I-F CRISPR-associated endoribonuclease Cas6/Csy4 [Pseudomonadota bacterium]
MKFYHEVTVIPNHEIGENFIWSKLFTQIHLGLASIKEVEKNGKEKSSIGISFPEYFMDKKFGVLGSKLRLFAQSESDLQKLEIQKWLSRLTDYIHVSDIREVPQKINGYAIYNRYQPKVNKERLARRHAKRHNIDYDTALDHYKDMSNKSVMYPYIKLKSLSSENEFCLWIKKTKTDQPSYQKFSTYGLSSVSTLPEF